MSWLQIVNVFFFQLLFIRLARIIFIDDDGKHRKQAYTIIYPVWPFTGWFNNYSSWPLKSVHHSRPFFIKNRI